MTILGTVNKSSIDQAYKNGLVKPNEYKAIQDNLISREIFLRAEHLSLSLDRFVNVLSGKDLIEEFYLRETGYLDLNSAIMHLAYNSPEVLLIDQTDINLLVLADVAKSKALLVRDLGDVNMSKHLDGIILADKDTIRSLDYLTKHKKGLWDLLEYLVEEI